MAAATTGLGSDGGKVGSAGGKVVERSVWEADSDEETQRGKGGKWHLRTGSQGSRLGKEKGGGSGSAGAGGKADGGKGKERWGKRSASDVVRSLFMKL